jgi:hypothetical protein
MGFTNLNDFDKMAVLVSQDQEFYKNLINQGKVEDALAIVDLLASFVISQEQPQGL